MKRHQSALIALAFGALLVVPALGAQGQPPRQDPKPAPEVTAITPTDLTAQPKPRAMAVTGRYFQDGLSVQVTTPGGAVLDYRTTAITDRRDTSFIVMVALAEPGPYEFVVVNPDGRASSPFKLQVRSAALLPAVTGIRPAAISGSASPQTITVDGQRFLPGLTVMVTEPAGNVQTITRNDVTQVLPESFQITLPLEQAGTYEIIVKNPDGATSKTFTFEVNRSKR
jgi:hypothetical protein